MTPATPVIQLSLVLLGGAAIGGGVFLLVAFLRGGTRASARTDRPAGPRATKLSVRATAAVAVGGAVLIATGWPVVAAGCGLLVLGWHGLVGGAAEERAATRRLEALAAWTDSLRESVVGTAGLEQAIPASVRAAAPTLQPHLVALVDRLHTRMPLSDALHRFADDIGDSSADLVIAALILNAKLRGPGLREVLGALAGSAREELHIRRRVEAERRSARRGVQIAVGASLGSAAALVVLRPSYVAEYTGPAGQLVLLVVAGLFAAGFAWMRGLPRFDRPGRTLAGPLPAPTTEAGVTR
ncbi:type II secretion system protein [Sphaerisporangium sp. NPDC049002]|uniref:type II secretion system F family protein n=1 Tax=Sphaerisporangium sp. NPDC049002 TaxID=3155392 RepID=UPI0033FC03CC